MLYNLLLCGCTVMAWPTWTRILTVSEQHNYVLCKLPWYDVLSWSSLLMIKLKSIIQCLMQIISYCKPIIPHLIHRNSYLIPTIPYLMPIIPYLIHITPYLIPIIHNFIHILDYAMTIIQIIDNTILYCTHNSIFLILIIHYFTPIIL